MLLLYFEPYIIQVSSLCMLYPLANFANLLMWGLVVLGATWAYVKYRYHRHKLSTHQGFEAVAVVFGCSPVCHLGPAPA